MMDSRDLVFRSYQAKQQFDSSNPAHEMQALYFLFITLILTILYYVLKDSSASDIISVYCNNLVCFVDFCILGSPQSTLPGSFPDDKSTNVTIDEHNSKVVDDQSSASSSTAVDQNERKRSTAFLEDTIDDLKEQLKKAKEYMQRYSNAVIREQNALLQVQSVQNELIQSRNALAAKREQSAKANVQQQNYHLGLALRQFHIERNNQVKSLNDNYQAEVARLVAENAGLRALAHEKNVNTTQQNHEHQLQDLKSVVEEKIISIKQLEAEVIRLRNESNKHEAKYHAANTELDGAKTLAEKIKQECKVVDTARNSLQTQMQNMEYQMQYEIDKLKNSNVKQQARVQELEARCAQSALNSPNFDQECARFNDAVAELGTANKVVEKFRNDCKSSEDERKALAQHLEYMHQQMQNEIDNLKTGNLSQQAQLRELERQKNDNILILQQFQQESAQLRAQLQEKVETDPQSKQKYEEEINRLTNQLQQSNTELNNLKALNQAPAAALQNNITSLQTELQKERIERARAQGRFDDTTKKLIDSNKKIEQLERSNKELQAQPQPKPNTIPISTLQTKLQEQATTLQNQHAQNLTTQTSNLQSRITDLETTVTNQTSTIADLTTSNQTLEWQVRQQTNINQRQASTISELETLLKQSDSQIEGIKSAFETTRTMLEAKIASLSTTQQQQATSIQQSPRRKRDLDTHYADTEADTDGDTTDQQQQPQAEPRVRQEPTPKRAVEGGGGSDKLSLDWELFEGPLPDIDAMVKQDEENAQRELEEALNQEMNA